MQIDIRRVLQRLLMGTPLLGAGCQGELGSPESVARPPEPQRSAVTSEPCTERRLMNNANVKADRKAALVIGADDDRWSDFYEACLARKNHCTELCRTATDAAFPPSPGLENALSSCALSSCTEQGRPVLYVTFTVQNIPPVGRRPAGFSCPESSEADPCAAWLARAAAMEAASIPAFAQLARELVAEGAPQELVARARAAMADEARHFRITRRLARAFGATQVDRPRVPPLTVRPLGEMALENIVEGCVLETFSALTAMWQAEHAADQAVRVAMVDIAADETRHAQLSWDVADFLMTRLSVEGRRAVAAAFVDASAALADVAAAPVDARLVDRLGVPDAATRVALATGLRASLTARAAV